MTIEVRTIQTTITTVVNILKQRNLEINNRTTHSEPRLTSHIHPYKVEGMATVSVLETVTARGLETALEDGRDAMSAKANVTTCFNKGILDPGVERNTRQWLCSLVFR